MDDFAPLLIYGEFCGAFCSSGGARIKKWDFVCCYEWRYPYKTDSREDTAKIAALHLRIRRNLMERSSAYTADT